MRRREIAIPPSRPGTQLLCPSEDLPGWSTQGCGEDIVVCWVQSIGISQTICGRPWGSFWQKDLGDCFSLLLYEFVNGSAIESVLEALAMLSRSAYG